MIYTETTVLQLTNDGKSMKSADRRELLGYMQRYANLSKAGAMAEMRSCSEQTLIDMLKDYRARTRRSAFDNLAEPEPVELLQPVKPSEKPLKAQKAKKVPYTLLLLSPQLEALRELSDRDGASVSHHIRMAVADYLRKHH